MAIISILCLSGNAQANFLEILNGATTTINPEAKIEGPIYRQSHKKQDQYGDKILSIILSEADKLAKKYLKEGNFQAYNAFLILALTVPNQEGLMVHFREVDAIKDNCNDSRSLGLGIENHDAKSFFQKTLVGIETKNFEEANDAVYNGFLVPCKNLKKSNTFRQLVAGGKDGSDVGIMQLSSLWNYENYLKPAKYSSVRKTIRYGQELLMDEFHYHLINGTKCMLDQKSSIDYNKLIRGSWSAYNGGPPKFCRFAIPHSPYAAFDRGFNGRLKQTLSIDETRYFGFDNLDGKLPLSKEAESALIEVIQNYKNKRFSQDAFYRFIN